MHATSRQQNKSKTSVLTSLALIPLVGFRHKHKKHTNAAEDSNQNIKYILPKPSKRTLVKIKSLKRKIGISDPCNVVVDLDSK